MKIDKAVNLLSQLPLAINTKSNHDNHVAVRLGIEALKQTKESRYDPSSWVPRKLPGED